MTNRVVYAIVSDAPPEILPLPVHPHACGEHGHINYWLRLECGSSPRLWGTRRGKGPVVFGERFIPTPVGNTSYTSLLSISAGGSSPRLWGTHSCNLIGFDPFRFIPTPVGNTFPLPRPRSCRPVHPHACGEHPPHHSRPKYCRGSSPRLWGTPRHAADRPVSARFIPTPVGNTFSELYLSKRGPVHPHACGEHARVRILHAGPVGSSPRLWGTLRHHSRHNKPSGSSPRLWGTLASIRRKPRPLRFIPTPVGNTVTICRGAEASRFIPTPVGNTSCNRSTLMAYDGSSPRLWGTPDRPGADYLGNGSSPRLWGTLLNYLDRSWSIGSSPRLWGTRRLSTEYRQ